jgi:chromosomal replication initiator protein
LELPTSLEPPRAWHQIRSELRRLVGDTTFEIWLAPLELQSWDGDVLFVVAPASTRSWVAKRFGRVLATCAEQVTGASVRIEFAGECGGTGEPAHIDQREPGPAPALNPRYRFEQFIIGDGNRLAHAAALAVAELPGQAYNPLFLHARPGLGKTHLLHAIGNYIQAFGGGARVRYTTVETFTNQFLGALQQRSALDRFKRLYRDADVLLIDDVQFLASKARTEEEFFHTFNSLYENGRQLVLTCDRLPRQLVSIEQRLRERFESGLVADIQPPDLATRLAILRKRAALDQVPLADDSVLELIARRVIDNVRSLEGALIRIVAYHSLTRHAIDIRLAAEVLDTMYPARQSDETAITDIQAAVCGFYELSIDELRSAERTARIVWPRQVAIYLARERTSASLPTIGSAFGGRRHSAVLHACKRVSARLAADPQATHELEMLSSILSSGGLDRRD